ncbi:fused MFS/spermidine synthase [Mesonia sp. K7]|uniref:fused MFS/spermidine synthase n=1 Tax=Mesonia sp. K7 TaxID=2218606 RepID=UPI000DA967EC|nr:fused MFS/spermidine synthase [Mesonia sp. K7]PZD78523.1 hypothetical protein DNG35_05535 [Mesonia sp. K7]
MVTELAGARILAPFFGSSLYSWASTLSITLLALMCGYYFGGYATTKEKLSSKKAIFLVFLLSGLLVLFLPSLGRAVMGEAIQLSFFTGIIISQLIFLFPPIFLMGMMSPMIIYQINKSPKQAGKSAGNIYAISTFGGILFTLVFGFVIIPNYGISLPVIILGSLVAFLSLLFLLNDKIIKPVGIILSIILLSQVWNAFQNYQNYSPSTQINERLIEYSEGILGELAITEQKMKSPEGNFFKGLMLKVNGVMQSQAASRYPKASLVYYVNFIRNLVGQLPQKKTALIIGLGAGNVYSDMKLYGIDVETVEIDQRIYDYGVKYFDMEPHPEKSHITDGRYFINTTNKKYDIILLDVIVGENVAEQLISLESFERLYNLLSEKGTLIMEHGGINDFSKNRFAPSVHKTLSEAGFTISMFNPVHSNKYNYGDVTFVATKRELDKNNIFVAGDMLLSEGPITDYEIFLSDFDTSLETPLLTDDKNKTDLLLKSHYMNTREKSRN